MKFVILFILGLIWKTSGVAGEGFSITRKDDRGSIPNNDIPDRTILEILMKIQSRLDSMDAKVDGIEQQVKEVKVAVTKTVGNVGKVEESVKKITDNFNIVKEDVKGAKKELRNLVVRTRDTEQRVVIVEKNVDKNISDVRTEGDAKVRQVERKCEKMIEEQTKLANNSLFMLSLRVRYEYAYKTKFPFQVSFQDVKWLTDHPHNSEVTNATNKVLDDFNSKLNAFKNMYGGESMGTLTDVLHQLDEGKKRDIWFGSIRRIMNLNKLKFVESPMDTIPVHGEFEKDSDGKVSVMGYVSIRTDEEWHPINYRSCWVPHTPFADKEANVTCRQGGYSSGIFISWESSRHYPFTKYVEVFGCTGKESRLDECASYHIHYSNHYYTNVMVKCYI